ncbi:MAG: pantetheine-phosphate adenylyltransferase [Thermoplasmatales archaeon]
MANSSRKGKVFYPITSFYLVKVLLGGTFSTLHKAHKIMISKGLQMGDLIIGITSDNFNFKKNYPVPPYEVRKRRVERYIEKLGKKAVINPLNDPFGRTLDPEFDAIVASNETVDFISEINFIRKSRGVKPLIVENIGTILASDLMPIKSERILRGEIDASGRRKKDIKIIIASKNDEKVIGAREFLSTVLKRISIKTVEPAMKLTPQPMGSEVLQGAVTRLEGIDEPYDYLIGIEAGLIQIGTEIYDFHVAAVRDSLGRTNFGISSGLPLSKDILKVIKEGDELDLAMSNLFGIKGSGNKLGAVYHLSKGMKKRMDLVKESLQSAFIERISESLPRIIK